MCRGFLSIILVFAWVGAQYDRVLGCTTLALVLTLGAVFLSSLRSAGFHFLPVAVGNVMLLLAYGNLLNAFRLFCSKPIGFSWLAGGLLWAILCLFPEFYYSQPKRVLVICLLCIIFTGALIRLLWRVHASLTVTFWPAQILLWIHLLFHVARLFLDDAVASPVRGSIGGSSFSVYVILESILFVIGLTFTILAMVNERTQIAHKLASMHDPLTSVWNRRALFEQAEKIAQRSARQTQTFVYSAVLFDLDHFKSINDRFGHQQGDQVLVDFCQVVQGLLPEEAHFARLGGEEFAAIIPGDAEQAQVVCERIRLATQVSQPNDVRYTVSIGFATALQAGQPFPPLLALADEALYRAKASGRNRIERYFTPLQPVQKAVLT